MIVEIFYQKMRWFNNCEHHSESATVNPVQMATSVKRPLM